MSGVLEGLDVSWDPVDKDFPATLTVAEVHLWRAPLNVDAPTLTGLSRALSSAEHERADRFHFERDRVRWVAARGWLRRLLAEYLDAHPAELCIEQHASGKPRLAAPARWLRFNVSHSAELAAFAVARDREVGVDVERVSDDAGAEPLARQFLSSREQAALAGLAHQARPHARLQCWTGKEAFLKASGLGLRAAPANVDVAALIDRTLRPSTRAEVDLGRWSLHAFDAGAGYVGAIAVEGRGARVPVAARPLTDLVGRDDRYPRPLRDRAQSPRWKRS